MKSFDFIELHFLLGIHKTFIHKTSGSEYRNIPHPLNDTINFAPINTKVDLLGVPPLDVMSVTLALVSRNEAVYLSLNYC